MMFKDLKQVIKWLEEKNDLIRIQEECDPELQMAYIQRYGYSQKSPALLFEKVKGSPYPALANLFGTIERTEALFKNQTPAVRALILNQKDPLNILKSPSVWWSILAGLKNAIPRKISKKKAQFEEISLDQIPQIKSWKDDGGAFLTLPQVYSQNPLIPGWRGVNSGMYRIQISGNDFAPNQEVGLHYQLHRGIGVHHQKALELNQPFKVCIGIGGPPSLTFSAVMPLPQDVPELAFAGFLGGRAIRYFEEEGYFVNADCDFCILGEIVGEKDEGPFGDHLGYYSLKHSFPCLKIHKVYAKKSATFIFTSVGRPPQEDTSFGDFIHKLTQGAISQVLPGVKAVHAVDEAGVHPLLLAIGSERYLPYKKIRPLEILTQAHAILGYGQMSLAKYLFIVPEQDNPPSLHNIQEFFMHILMRADWSHNLHFMTKTTIDTLDYSGDDIHIGSKLIIAVAGQKRRNLASQINSSWRFPHDFSSPHIAFPGVAIFDAPQYTNSLQEQKNYTIWESQFDKNEWSEFPLIIICDNSEFTSDTIANWLWVVFTRSNPANDIFGIDSFIDKKHWGAHGSLIIDARIKPQHAPELIECSKAIDKSNQILQKINLQSKKEKELN
jgi:4-hydroxy-3-polyprenylbenzoate decarboxylase